jgi:multidrug efflux pump
VFYSQDQAPFAAQQVTELQGNILTALALVMVLVVAAMGLRSGSSSASAFRCRSCSR